MSDEKTNLYSDLKAKAQNLLKSYVPSEFSTQNSIQEPSLPKPPIPQSEQDKLKDLIKKLFADKNQLKNELDKEKLAHKDDVSRLTNELSNLKSRFSNLAENIANKPTEASPEQLKKIEQLNSSISKIQIDIKNSNKEYSELQINSEVLKKQSIQYKVRIEQLQEDLQMSETNTQKLSLIRTDISKAEDEILNKVREIKQHEQTTQWNNSETQKLNQTLDQLLNQHPTLELHSFDSIYIHQPIYNFRSSCLKIYNELNFDNIKNLNDNPNTFNKNSIDIDFNNNNSDKNKDTNTHFDEIDDSILADFILSIPLKIKNLESENQRLMQQSLKNRRMLSKLQHLESKAIAEEAKMKAKKDQMESSNSEKPLHSPEKLKKAIRKLTAMNKEKDEAITKLESIIARQQKGIEKVIESPSTNTALALAMRNVFGKLRTCARSEKKDLCEQGKKILEAMLGNNV